MREQGTVCFRRGYLVIEKWQWRRIFMFSVGLGLWSPVAQKKQNYDSCKAKLEVMKW